MIPITCNAIGDIVAVVQLVRALVTALDDARGSAAAYRLFIHELRVLGIVMEKAYGIAEASDDAALRQAVLDEVQLFCGEIVRAGRLMEGFEELAAFRAQSLIRDDAPPRVKRALLLAKKLQWHFLRASDALDYADRFHDSLQRLNALVGLINNQEIDRSISHLSGQVQRASSRDRVAIIQEVRMSTGAIASEVQAAEQCIVDAINHLPSRSSNDYFIPSSHLLPSTMLERDAFLAQQTVDIVLDRLAMQASPSERDRFVSFVMPFAIVGTAFVLHCNVDPRWHGTTLWSAVSALVLYILRVQSSVPASVWSRSENVIILIDALGERIPVAFQLCDSLETLHLFIEMFYAAKKRVGYDHVQQRRYELYSSGSTQALTPASWSSHISQGVTIEMGIVNVFVTNARDRPPKERWPICLTCFQKSDVPSGPGSQWLPCRNCDRLYARSQLAFSPISANSSHTYQAYTEQFFAARPSLRPPSQDLTLHSNTPPQGEKTNKSQYVEPFVRIHYATVTLDTIVDVDATYPYQQSISSSEGARHILGPREYPPFKSTPLHINGDLAMVPSIRHGFWNRRGDYLLKTGYIIRSPAYCAYPEDLSNYPDGDRFLDHNGREVEDARFVEHPWQDPCSYDMVDDSQPSMYFVFQTQALLFVHVSNC